MSYGRIGFVKRLVLIDGNAILHRAFHALPPLTSKSGEIVNAVYGFFSMFLKIIGDLKPEYVVVCFDKAAPTFRQQLYVGYQAKRPKIADELVPQIIKVHEILNAAKVSIFEVDGYEADDLIGTLAAQTVAWGPVGSFPSAGTTPRSLQGIEVIIVSGDRDMLQLVNSHVKVLAPIKGITEMILFDEKGVMEKYGIKPTQIVDYKALVGDASDNYPGVAGIGPKTARDLLQKYETFENLYRYLSKLPEKIALKLSTDAEAAALAKKLAQIVADAPITLKLDQCSYIKLDTGALREEFEKLGFRSLLKRLDGGSRQKKQPEEQPKKGDRQLNLL